MSRTACILTAVLIVGCQPAGPDRGERPPPSNRAALEDDPPAMLSDSLRLWLDAPDEAPAGAPVRIVLGVENVADRPLDLYLTGRPIAFDLIVADEKGEVVWRRLAGEVIPAILQIRTLGPGDTLELEDSWDQRTKKGEPIPPGDYTVRGELPTEDRPLSTPEKPLRIRSP